MNRSALSFTQSCVLAAKRVVRQAVTIGVLGNGHEPFGIVAFAGVEAEHLLVKVAV